MMSRGIFFIFAVLGLQLLISESERSEAFDQKLESLQFFDANRKQDFDQVKGWFEKVQSVRGRITSEEVALSLLEKELCHSVLLPDGCNSFRSALEANRSLHGVLMLAESIAVTMYTSEFYKDLNRDLANGTWEPYLTFTYFLHSAMVKLSARNPISVNQTLYRGLNKKFSKPSASRIFWKTFTSTSSSLEEALEFGQETVIEFQSPASRFGVHVKNLSISPSEEEVLLSPFESFDFKEEDEGRRLVFRSSDTQELLKNSGEAMDCKNVHRSLSLVVAFVSLVLMTFGWNEPKSV